MADTGQHRDRDIPTEAEIRAILAKCSRTAPTGIRDRALITVLYRTGLRISEALDLKSADVDHERGTIRVQHGKGDRFRTVGIDEGALAVLDLWMAERKRLGFNGRQRLFCTLKGTPLSANQARQMVKRRSAKADVDKSVHPHSFRHAHAVELVNEGVSVATIQRQLGHASLATTDIYLRGIAPADVIAMGKARKWEA
jgi:integrase/recombinase XerD